MASGTINHLRILRDGAGAAGWLTESTINIAPRMKDAVASGREVKGRVEAVRSFSTVFAKKAWLMGGRGLHGPFTSAEAGVIGELAGRESAFATDLGVALALDPGYLSRILGRLGERGLLRKEACGTDGRRRRLRLTGRGREAFAALERRRRKDIGAFLGGLSPAEQERLVRMMGAIESLLRAGRAGKGSFVLRPPRPGDMGWVVQRHGELYHEEYGWDGRFEALVAGIVAEFVKRYDPRMDRCWMAEMDGEAVGCVFLVRQSRRVAKLRLLLVEPRSRDLGIGERLVSECVLFAREAGYRKMVLWTNSILHAARHIYERAGFRMVGREGQNSFGHRLIFETWELDLGPRPAKGTGKSSVAHSSQS